MGALRVSEAFLGAMTVGFPADFIASTGPWVYGDAGIRLDGR
jgi:hypothetical protein